MKKAILIAAAVALIATPAVFAQDSVIWLDARANDHNGGPPTNFPRTITGSGLGTNANNPYTFGVNGGRRGAGQVLYLEPKHADGYESSAARGPGFPNFDLDLPNGDGSTGTLWIYMDVNDDPSGTGDVIAAVGLDVNVLDLNATLKNRLTDTNLFLFDGLTVPEEVFNSITPTGLPPWNNHVDATPVVADPPTAEGAKAVRVAVDPGPVYNAALGLQPNLQGATDEPYRIGRIDFEAGIRNCSFLPPGDNVHRDASTFNVFLSNNNLLTVRTYDGVGDAEELVSYGYDGAVPETPAVSGNDMNATSIVPDAQVIIMVKGDFNGNGRVEVGDTPLYLAAVTVNNPVDQAYLGDWNGNARVEVGDTPSYLDALTIFSGGGGTCP